uniref:Iron-sulfur cluster co-chaperone protein HscB n=1 Tax=Leptobrachium leishanense TaxID=445787 RepID=A0A8C5LSX6_9ANUR
MEAVRKLAVQLGPGHWLGRVICRGALVTTSCCRRIRLASTCLAPVSLMVDGAYTVHHSRTMCVNAASRLCWSCQAVLSHQHLFCPSCHSLQPPDGKKNYFQILDCDKSFVVNIKELQKKYRNLQRSLHPDYFSRKSQVEREMSEKQSSLVNKAYNTLLSPLKRGIYLLSLSGITLEEGAESGADSQFLFDILEINEKLNECTSSAEIEEIGNFVQVKYKSLILDVRDAFLQGDLHGAKLLLTKMKYFSNIQNQVKDKIIPS